MPIQCTIAQPTGVNATYHVIENGAFCLGPGTLNITINSYLDSAHIEQALSTMNLDISPVLTSMASTSSNDATVKQIVQSIIEQYLLTIQTFAGGSQVS
jgi:hypothetical protein